MKLMGGVEKKFTLDELKQYDGKDGRASYIAYKGKVYDVTDSSFWMDGDHLGLHKAGEDLTEQLAEAPHGEEELSNVKLIGLLVQASD